MPGPPTNTRILRAGRRKIASEVSYLAARLIAEEGITDVALALKKAALKLRVTELANLPSAREVQLALKTHYALFQADSQPQECLSLRRAAIEAMRWLDRFSPWLVGNVLDGSANRFSQIKLEMVLDDAKQLDIFLLNAGVGFEIHGSGSSQSQHGKLEVPGLIYELFVDGNAICISVFTRHTAQFSRSANKPNRARLAEVEALPI